MKIRRSTISSRLATLEHEITLLRSQNEVLLTKERMQLDPEFYVAFENRFRGSFETIKGRVSTYINDLTHLANSNKKVLDIGCGRGELLAVLKESGIHAIGVDSNQSMIDSLLERGFEVYCADLSDFLKRTPDSSLGAVTMLHVVEHLKFDVLLLTLMEVLRVLEPGGVFIAETPNSLNLSVGASTFWLDPTHQKPLHPDLLQFLSGHSGFMQSEIRYLSGTGTEALDVCLVSKKQR